MVSPGHDIEIVVEHNQLQHALVGSGRVVGKAVSKVTVTAFRVRMTRLFLNLLAGHHELRGAERSHPLFIGMAPHALVARLVRAVERDEDDDEPKLENQYDDPAFVAEKLPEFADSHESTRQESGSLGS